MEVKDFKKLVENAAEKKSTPVVVNKSISTFSLLGLVLVVLKCTGYISCSWWIVLAPFWIPIAIAVALLAVLLLFIAVVLSKTEDETSNIDVSIDASKEEITQENKGIKKVRRASKKKKNEHESTTETTGKDE